MDSANDSPNCTTPETQSFLPERPTIVGVYGLPGSGKAFLLKQVEKELGTRDYTFYEGSEVIDKIYQGGLEVFKKLDEQHKLLWREKAIDKIRKECAASGKGGVVAGHFIFWPDGAEDGTRVFTDKDAAPTPILYIWAFL
jgi:hypothetical protein